MTTPSTFDADTMNSAQPVPSAQPAQSDQQAPQPAQQPAVPTKFDAATMQTAQSLPAAPAKFDAATMQSAQPVQAQAAPTPPPARSSADVMMDIAKKGGAMPFGEDSKISKWVKLGLLKVDVLDHYLQVAEDYYGEKGNILWDPIPEHLRRTDPLVQLPENKTLAKIPFAGEPFKGGQIGIQDYTNRNASEFVSQQTSPMAIALVGGGTAVNAAVRVGAAVRSVEAVQQAVTEMDAAEAIHATRMAELSRGVEVAKAAQADVASVEAEVQAGTKTAKDLADAQLRSSETVKSLTDLKETVGESAVAREAAAAKLTNAAKNAATATRAAKDVPLKDALAKVPQAVTKIAQKGMLATGVTVGASMLPDRFEGQREGENSADYMERKYGALGWSLLGLAEAGHSLNSESLSGDISKLPDSFKNDAQRLIDWSNQRKENKAALQSAIAVEKIKQAVPSKGRTQYTAEDMDRALAHAEEAKAGGEKITNLAEFRDAVEEGRQGIEDNLAEKAEPYKDEPLVSKPEDSVKVKVAEKLDEMAKVDGNFAGAMGSLAEFNITDPTVGETIALISKLNNYQRTAMKGANNFDIHQMIETKDRKS